MSSFKNQSHRAIDGSLHHFPYWSDGSCVNHSEQRCVWCHVVYEPPKRRTKAPHTYAQWTSANRRTHNNLINSGEMSRHASSHNGATQAHNIAPPQTYPINYMALPGSQIVITGVTPSSDLTVRVLDVCAVDGRTRSDVPHYIPIRHHETLISIRGAMWTLLRVPNIRVRELLDDFIRPALGQQQNGRADNGGGRILIV
ncbi:hypothetical protein LTR37_005566 [Vermiconidia calcicola]|uniref:Uncharacterized protein n=1 Tax=Vermiconidia calcicola TaxID=1690605 RepID=A0ACC3NKK5_9PEZI|nr:hypothetical protein LTR37_005566 [Vermiconidia calcicola]